jgi:dTMP kinase
MAKLIVIEGTDCSGKETQSKMLVDRLNKDGIRATILSFPMYDTATGKIIGACYLGKEEMCKDVLAPGITGLFEEGASCVDPITSSLFYAADRRYNLPVIEKAMDEYDVVVLNRYTYSNMAHQAGKIKNSSERTFMFQLLEHLEFNVCKLPRADKVIFLHVPYENALILKNNRKEKPDQLESVEEHLRNAEETYLQLADYYNFETIDCVYDNKMKSIDEIHKEVYKIVERIVNS